MNNKLTLTIEEEVIKKAKEYSKQKGRSLSELIENYLQLITSSDNQTSIELTPKIKKLKGSIKLEKDFNLKEGYTKHLSNKHK
jgi:cobalamin biosynthesis Mg chelatase CobN